MWDATHSCAVERGEGDMTHSFETWLIHVRHDSFMNGEQCVYQRIHSKAPCVDVTHSYVWHDSFIRVTWLIHMRHDSFIRDVIHSCKTWLIPVRHDSFMWDMTGSYVAWCNDMRGNTQQDAALLREFFINWIRSYETWLVNMWHDSFICKGIHSRTSCGESREGTGGVRWLEYTEGGRGVVTKILIICNSLCLVIQDLCIRAHSHTHTHTQAHIWKTCVFFLDPHAHTDWRARTHTQPLLNTLTHMRHVWGGYD